LGDSRGFGSKEAPAEDKNAVFSLKILPFVGFIYLIEFCIKELTQCFQYPFRRII